MRALYNKDTLLLEVIRQVLFQEALHTSVTMIDFIEDVFLAL
jgi:hypothetical protein